MLSPRKTKTVATIQTNNVDTTTGEVLSSSLKEKVVVLNDHKHFCAMYVNLLPLLCQLEYSEVKTLLWCALKADLGTNEIILSPLKRQLLADEVGLTVKTVGNAITELVRKGLFQRLSTSHYHIHPELFWKGHKNQHGPNILAFQKGAVGIEKGA